MDGQLKAEKFQENVSRGANQKLLNGRGKNLKGWLEQDIKERAAVQRRKEERVVQGT